MADEPKVELTPEQKTAKRAKNNGETWAFPPHPECDSSGMNLREWFAGQALAGLTTHGYPPDQVAACAVQHADALLLELAKTSS